LRAIRRCSSAATRGRDGLEPGGWNTDGLEGRPLAEPEFYPAGTWGRRVPTYRGNGHHWRNPEPQPSGASGASSTPGAENSLPRSRV
jgi:hypothetical protein